MEIFLAATDEKHLYVLQRNTKSDKMDTRFIYSCVKQFA